MPFRTLVCLKLCPSQALCLEHQGGWNWVPFAASPQVTPRGGKAMTSSLFMPLVQMSGQLRPSAPHTSALNHLATFKALSGRCLLLCNPRKTDLDFSTFFFGQKTNQNTEFFFFFGPECEVPEVPESLSGINYNTFQYLQEKQNVSFQNIITSHALL